MEGDSDREEEQIQAFSQRSTETIAPRVCGLGECFVSQRYHDLSQGLQKTRMRPVHCRKQIEIQGFKWPHNGNFTTCLILELWCRSNASQGESAKDEELIDDVVPFKLFLGYPVIHTSLCVWADNISQEPRALWDIIAQTASCDDCVLQPIAGR